MPSSVSSTTVTAETSPSASTTPITTSSNTVSETSKSTLSSSPSTQSTGQASSTTVSGSTTTTSVVSSSASVPVTSQSTSMATDSSTHSTEMATGSTVPATSSQSATTGSSTSVSSPTTLSSMTTSQSSTANGSSTSPTSTSTSPSTLPSEGTSSTATTSVGSSATVSSSTPVSSVASSTTVTSSTSQSTSPVVTSASSPDMNTMVGGNVTTSTTSTSQTDTSTKASTMSVPSSESTLTATQTSSVHSSTGGSTTAAMRSTSESTSNSPTTLKSTVAGSTGTMPSSVSSTTVTAETSPSASTTPITTSSNTVSETSKSTLSSSPTTQSTGQASSTTVSGSTTTTSAVSSSTSVPVTSQSTSKTTDSSTLSTEMATGSTTSVGSSTTVSSRSPGYSFYASTTGRPTASLTMMTSSSAIGITNSGLSHSISTPTVTYEVTNATKEGTTTSQGINSGTDVTRASSSGTTPSATTEMPTTASVVSTDIFTIVLDKTDDGTSVAIPVSGNIPVYGTRYKQIHVSVNGLVSLGNNTVGYNPRQLPIGNNGTVLFAPLWTDFDIRNTSESSVFATVYQNVKSNTNITQEWRQYLEPGFNPTWALDVHWEQVCPFPAQMYDGNENTTFRLVLLTDGDRTLVAFDYDRDRALPYSLTRSPVIGLDFGSAGFSTFFNRTGTPEAVDVSTTIGNLGRIGKWLFKLYNNNDVSNATAVCRDWLMQESRDEVTSPFPACPCSTSQVFADPNFHFDNVTYCADRVAATNQGYGLHCCYNPTDTPIRGSLLTGSRGPSAFYRYHPEMYPALHQSRDLEARDACCTDDVTCEQYFSRRIVSSCSNYEPPIIAVAFGSPHLQTFDGLEYTFSGNEEYLMAETDTGSALHAKMEPVWISDDPNQPNNSLTAFATFTFVGPTNISVSQNEKRTGIELTIAGQALTDSFKRDSNFRKTYNNLTVYKNCDDCVVIVETPGFSSTFCEAKGSISAMVVTPPEAVRKTRGLLGTANSNKSDDLSMRGSTDKPLPITSTDREIYSQMTSWSVSPGTNISLPKNETLNVTDVTPLFLDELYHDVYRDVNATDYVACLISDTVVSKACLYNRLILQDDVTANKTRAVADTIMTQKEVLQTKIPPLETGESRMLNVTVGEPMSLYLKHASSVHARCNSDINASCIDNTTGVMFTWTPVSLDTVHLSFAVEDPKLRLASETVEYEIQICDCSGHGTCRFDRLLSQSHPTDNFRLASCDCQIGWTGSHCELDFDGCQGAPCSDWGSNCTDLIPAEHQKQKYPYKCSECPSGYRRKGIGCFEINECNENASLCDNEPGICFNTNGNYTCRCPRESAWNGSLCISYPELSTTIPESSTTRNPVDLCGYYNETHKCQNNGTCQLQNTNDSICVCTSGYHGDLCELPNVASARDGDWVVEILLPAAAAVAIAIATLCCILAVVRRRKKRSLDEESDQDSYGIRGSYAVPSSIFLPRFNTNWRQFYGSPSTWNDTAPTVHRERPLQFPITYPYDNETNSSGPENSFDDQSLDTTPEWCNNILLQEEEFNIGRPIYKTERIYPHLDDSY